MKYLQFWFPIILRSHATFDWPISHQCVNQCVNHSPRPFDPSGPLARRRHPPDSCRHISLLTWCYPTLHRHCLYCTHFSPLSNVFHAYLLHDTIWIAATVPYRTPTIYSLLGHHCLSVDSLLDQQLLVLGNDQLRLIRPLQTPTAFNYSFTSMKLRIRNLKESRKIQYNIIKQFSIGHFKNFLTFSIQAIWLWFLFEFIFTENPKKMYSPRWATKLSFIDN